MGSNQASLCGRSRGPAARVVQGVWVLRGLGAPAASWPLVMDLLEGPCLPGMVLISSRYSFLKQGRGSPRWLPTHGAANEG